jgi:hypothetical protein
MIDEAKTASVHIDKQDMLGRELAGATLSLTGTSIDGSAVYFTEDSIQLGEDAQLVNGYGSVLTWISGNSATLISNLPSGEYVLHEDVAPDDYELATDITFTITNGELTSIDGVLVSSPDEYIVMFDALKNVAPGTYETTTTTRPKAVEGDDVSFTTTTTTETETTTTTEETTTEEVTTTMEAATVEVTTTTVEETTTETTTTTTTAETATETSTATTTTESGTTKKLSSTTAVKNTTKTTTKTTTSKKTSTSTSSSPKTGVAGVAIPVTVLLSALAAAVFARSGRKDD